MAVFAEQAPGVPSYKPIFNKPCGRSLIFKNLPNIFDFYFQRLPRLIFKPPLAFLTQRLAALVAVR